MNLFDGLKDATKDNNRFQDLIGNLSEFIENKFSSGKSEIFERKEKSLLQEVEEQGKVTTTYRDKMLVERSNLLNNYAKENLEKGSMYFVYSKSSSKPNSFNLCVCGEKFSNKVITVEECELPDGIGVDSVLRLKDDKYIFDEKATEYICNEMKKIVNTLLEQQNLELSSKRIEGNIYEIVEIYGNIALIMNTTQNDGECFEEIDISKDVLSELKVGDCIQHINGSYQVFSR